MTAPIKNASLMASMLPDSIRELAKLIPDDEDKTKVQLQLSLLAVDASKLCGKLELLIEQLRPTTASR